MGAPIITDFNTSPGPDNSTLVQVTGSGFGCDQKSSFLRIGEFIALITFWSDTKVEGYVPNTVIKQLSRSHKQLQDIGIYTHDDIDKHIDDDDIHSGNANVPGIKGNYPAISDNGKLIDSLTNPGTFALKQHSHVGVTIEYCSQVFVISELHQCNFLLDFPVLANSLHVMHNGVGLTPGDSNDFRVENGYLKINNDYIRQVDTTPGDILTFSYVKGV